MKDYSKIAGYYNKYSSWYDIERNSRYFSLINQREIQIVKKYVKNKSVLEIGCGTGLILSKVSDFAKRVNGVDVSPQMIAKAKEKGLNVQVANAISLPFKDNSFDVIYSFKVLPHIPELKRAIYEIARVVKKDGTIILEFYNTRSIKKLTNKAFNTIKKRQVYLKFDTCTDITNYLPPGWQIVSKYGSKLVLFDNKLFTSKPMIALEKRLCKTALKKYAGYIIIAAKRVPVE